MHKLTPLALLPASRSDRMAKYNQLLRIEQELGEVAYCPGKKF